MKALLILVVCLFAVPSALADNGAGHYAGPFYRCTNGEVTRPHVGQWHAAQLEAQGWTCNTPKPNVVVSQPDGRGLYCSDTLVTRTDGTVGNALDLPLADFPTSGGRPAWFVVGVGLTCDNPVGLRSTGRLVDQTGSVSTDGGAVYEEMGS